MFKNLFLHSCLWGISISQAAEIRMGVKPGLKFDLPGFHIKPAEEIKLIFTNNDEMMHNIVFTMPEKRLQVVEAAIALGAEGLAKHFVPDVPAVLAYTPIVQPGQAYTLQFKAPDAPGEYPYVCTFPGHGFVMHGKMFVAQQRPSALDVLLEKGKAEPVATVSELPLSKAKLMRTFMPGSSPAAIAVALPGGHSYCWDAGNCRLRYVWRGGFIQRNGSYGRWRTLPTLLGSVYYREPSLPFRFEGEEEAPITKFLGYRFIDGIPEFRYQLGNCEVREFLAKLPGKSGLIRRFTIKGLSEKTLLFHKDPLSGVEFHSDQGIWNGNTLKLAPKEASSFTLKMVEIPNQAPTEYWSMDDLSRSYSKHSLVEGHLGRAWRFSSAPLIRTPHAFADFQKAFATSFWVQVSASNRSVASFCGWGEPGQGPTIYYEGNGAGLQVGTPPETPVNKGGYLEAENAKVKGAVITGNNAGHTGTGYVDFKANAGETIEWDPMANEAGRYILRFRYALAGGTRPLRVELNDITLAEKADFADSGGWTSWKNLDFPVTLQKGKQIIRLSSIGSSGPNVDHLSLLYLDGKDKQKEKPRKPPTAPKSPAKGHALEKGVWHHILVNYSDGKLTLYLDGKCIRRKNFPTESFLPNAMFYLGPIASGSSYIMDEFRLYARSLSGAEILELQKR